MILSELKLQNFRNYSNQILNFNNKFNFIYGKNGSGKTNILEGISLISLGRSFLSSPDNDCLMLGKDNYSINGCLLNDKGNMFNLFVSYDRVNKRKSFELNREKIKSFTSEIFGRFPLVYVTPGSLNITYGNPSERRKFFDITIAQTNRLYLDYLKSLNRLLKQKNALLRDKIKYKKSGDKELVQLLNTYNENIAGISANIVMRRLSFLEEFEKYLTDNYILLATDGSKPDVRYKSPILEEYGSGLSEKPSIDYLSELYKIVFSEVMDEEIGRGISVAGPQRDDYIFSITKENSEGNALSFVMRNFASQGEHKTLVIALKLAEYYYTKDKLSTCPMLLFDDILSELDSERVNRIIELLIGFGQVFLTTTEEKHINSITKIYGKNRISVFNVKNGYIN